MYSWLLINVLTRLVRYPKKEITVQYCSFFDNDPATATLSCVSRIRFSLFLFLKNQVKSITFNIKPKNHDFFSKSYYNKSSTID